MDLVDRIDMVLELSSDLQSGKMAVMGDKIGTPVEQHVKASREKKRKKQKEQYDTATSQDLAKGGEKLPRKPNQ
jgi:hypothetical protein